MKKMKISKDHPNTSAPRFDLLLKFDLLCYKRDAPKFVTYLLLKCCKNKKGSSVMFNYPNRRRNLGYISMIHECLS